MGTGADETAGTGAETETGTRGNFQASRNEKTRGRETDATTDADAATAGANDNSTTEGTAATDAATTDADAATATGSSAATDAVPTAAGADILNDLSGAEDLKHNQGWRLLLWCYSHKTAQVPAPGGRLATHVLIL